MIEWWWLILAAFLGFVAGPLLAPWLVKALRWRL